MEFFRDLSEVKSEKARSMLAESLRTHLAFVLPIAFYFTHWRPRMAKNSLHDAPMIFGQYDSGTAYENDGNTRCAGTDYDVIFCTCYGANSANAHPGLIRQGAVQGLLVTHVNFTLRNHDNKPSTQYCGLSVGHHETRDGKQATRLDYASNLPFLTPSSKVITDAIEIVARAYARENLEQEVAEVIQRVAASATKSQAQDEARFFTETGGPGRGL